MSTAELVQNLRDREIAAQQAFVSLARTVAEGKPITEAVATKALQAAGRSAADFAGEIARQTRIIKLCAIIATGPALEARWAALTAETSDVLKEVKRVREEAQRRWDEVYTKSQNAQLMMREERRAITEAQAELARLEAQP